MSPALGPRSSIALNGGEEALINNLPSPSPSTATCESSFQNPPKTLDARPQPPPPVPSPCIGVCKFNDGGFCNSCLRNTIEKVRWPTMAEAEKAFVVATCAKRKANPHYSRRSDPENVPAN